MDTSNEDQRWIDFYDKMGDGKIPYNSKFYLIDDYTSPQEGCGTPSLQIVSPTQQQVEQARMQLKRNIAAVAAQAPTAKKRRMTGGSIKRSKSKKPTAKKTTKKATPAKKSKPAAKTKNSKPVLKGKAVTNRKASTKRKANTPARRKQVSKKQSGHGVGYLPPPKNGWKRGK